MHRYKKVGTKSNVRIFTTRRSSRSTTIIVGRKQNVMNVHRMLQNVRAYSGSAYEYSQVTFQLSYNVPSVFTHEICTAIRFKMVGCITTTTTV